MTTHSTNSGHIELLDSWGHGRAARRDWRHMPAVLVADDDDGHYDAWRFTGARRDAAEKIASFFSLNDGDVAVLDGAVVRKEAAPEGFWAASIDDRGELVEVVPQAAAFPHVVAY